MMGGCYVCRYCCVKFPNQTPRAIVRHTELYHKSEVTKFLDDPVNHPLVCGLFLHAIKPLNHGAWI